MTFIHHRNLRLSSRPRLSTNSALLRLVHHLNPEHLILRNGDRCVEVTIDIFVEEMATSDFQGRGPSIYDLSVPRRGWVILTRRSTVRRLTTESGKNM